MNGFPESKQLQKTAPAASHLTGTRKEPEKLTQKRVRELLDYDPETGLLTWKVVKQGYAKIGAMAGSLNRAGYVRVKIAAKRYPAARIIWLWYYGYFPENEVDHINRVRNDNRISNLREVSRSCNMRNRNMQCNNKTGVNGVIKQRGGFRVMLPYAGKQRFVCDTKDFTEAVAHRLAAEQCLGYSSCDNQSSAYLYMQKYLKEGGI